MTEEVITELNSIVGENAKALVGVLCKRVELFEKENVLTPSLYKAITKELIYENSRNLKKIISASFCTGKIVFK